MNEEDLPLFKHSAKEYPDSARKKSEQLRERRFGKYIVYVDESGDHGIASIDKDYPIFVLAFCIQLPFEILFSDKKAMSSGLQLADLVARPVGLHVLRPDQPNRAWFDPKT